MGGRQIRAHEKALILELARQGVPRKDIAARLNVSRDVVDYAIRGGKRAQPRPCARCGRENTRRHAWCLDCQRAHARDRKLYGPARVGRPPETACSRPPPPPPGFDERDRYLGRPFS